MLFDDFITPFFIPFIVSHGILFIFHSELWMIFAKCGVPQHIKKWFFTYFSPATKTPIRQCDPFICLYIHRVDLVLGHILLFLGAFWLGDGSNRKSPQLIVTKLTIATGWIFTILCKIYIHTKYKKKVSPAKNVTRRQRSSHI